MKTLLLLQSEKDDSFAGVFIFFFLFRFRELPEVKKVINLKLLNQEVKSSRIDSSPTRDSVFSRAILSLESADRHSDRRILMKGLCDAGQLVERDETMAE